MNMVVGMKYMIKRFDKRPKHWNSKGHMDKWMGKIVEVTWIGKSNPCLIKVKGDIRYECWNWREIDFEYIDVLSEEDFIL